MDKVKEMASKVKGGSSGGSSGGSNDKMEEYSHKGVDMATDKAGMGDKYDSKINEQVDKQVKNYQEGQSK